MKVLTILQPFATLIALGEKHIETRGWRPDYHGPIVIHAGKGSGMIRECWSEPIKSLLLKHGITRVDQMPFGFAIAVSKLASVARSETLARSIPAQERLLGNYLPHRWGWKLEGTRRLVRPIPLRGEQGLWDWEPHAGFVWEFVEPPRVETSDESFAKLKKEMDKYPAARDRINASYPPDKDPA